MANDPRDFTDKYNTELSADDEIKFQKWAKKTGHSGDTYDYDLRGAFKSGASRSDNGHLTDEYKKPNHPTFSDQSKYHNVDGNVGGKWDEVDGKTRFTPGDSNHLSTEELKQYFKKVEPGVGLNDTREERAMSSAYKKASGK